MLCIESLAYFLVLCIALNKGLTMFMWGGGDILHISVLLHDEPPLPSFSGAYWEAGT